MYELGKNVESNMKKCISTGKSNLTDIIFYDPITTGPCGIIHTLPSLLKRSIFSTRDRSAL